MKSGAPPYIIRIVCAELPRISFGKPGYDHLFEAWRKRLGRGGSMNWRVARLSFAVCLAGVCRAIARRTRGVPRAPVLAVVLLICRPALVPCLAADPSDWAKCGSDDLDVNIPACTAILGEANAPTADLIRAHRLRAKAYLSQHSFISAGNDFGQILKIEPGNVDALVGRGLAEFRQGNREKAVVDYIVATRLDSQKVNAMTQSSDDLKELASLAAQSTVPEAEVQSLLSQARSPGTGREARTTEAAVSDCDRLASSPTDATRPAGVAGVEYALIDTPQAIPACRDALRQHPNDPRLAFQLGRALDRQGGGGAAEAASLYKTAADAGFALAVNNLANLYQRGTGVARDLALARQLFERAAGSGVPNAMLGLGNLYESGSGVTKDYVVARQWFEKAASAGIANANSHLGDFYRNGWGVAKDYSTARSYYEKAVAGGDEAGMGGLGTLYQNGWGAPKDFDQARKWYVKAADAGQTNGMTGLGILYQFGLGIPKDYSLAYQWYQKSANAGEPVAMNNLGSLYQNGFGVAKSYDEAFKWYHKAADLGQSNGMTGLGILYQFGWGVPKDYALAYQWYQKAASAGEPAAMNNLGSLYQNGLGVAKSYDDAFKWYRKAADLGQSNGMLGLGMLYQNGWGVAKDYGEARRWYEKGALAGEPSAMMSLGAFYFNGWGGPKDRGQALQWTEKAAAAGNETAKKNLLIMRRSR
jgi:TPR repeat protein